VSEVSLGGAWLAGRGGNLSIEQSAEIVRTALALGVNYIDTARYYGRSEEILGVALEGVPQPYYLATKAGCVPHDFDYSADAMLRSFETSLRLLRRDRVDLLQIHDVSTAGWDRVMRKGGTLEALHRLQREGIVAGIGVTGRDPDVQARFAATDEFDSVLSYCDYDVTTRLARETLLPVAAEHRVAVVLGSPLRVGLLGQPRNAALSAWAAPLGPKLERLHDLAEREGMPLRHLAIRYLLSDPDVATVLSGAGSVDELLDALSAASAGPLSSAVLAEIRDIQEMPSAPAS
jgi:aryl-alcohol dehydrogenase-like predicted oxidoreductase